MSRSSYAVLGITAAAAIVRFATLDHQSFDHDEAVTAARVLRSSLFDTLSVVGDSERSPPLHYILAWGWSKLFGTGEVGLRSLSALFGTLTVPAAYLAARELASRRAGLIAASLVALNPWLVWYSQQARSYALLIFFAAWALYFFARALRDHSPKHLALWAAASALALSSHYFAVFLIIPEGLWLLAAVSSRRHATLAVAATAVVGLALLPLAVAQEGTGRSNTFTDQSLSTRAGKSALAMVASEEPGPLAGSSSVDRLQTFAALLSLALAIAAVALVVRRGLQVERRGATVAGLVGGVAFASPFALALIGVDFVDQRNLIGSVVPFLVAAGIAFGLHNAKRLGAVLAMAAAALFAVVLVAVYASGQMQRPDWRTAAEAIGPPNGARVLVVPSNGDDPLIYYLHAHKFVPGRLPGGIRVREIDVLSKALVISPPGRGFRLVQQRGLAPSFVLRRYRSSRPVRIRPGDVAGQQVLMESSAVLADGLE